MITVAERYSWKGNGGRGVGEGHKYGIKEEIDNEIE
jgi:hypothetical protein